MDGQSMQLLFPIFLIAIFYFLLIRPQRKKEKQVNEMRSKLKIGDKILLSVEATRAGGGYRGTYAKYIKAEKLDIYGDYTRKSFNEIENILDCFEFVQE
jgi:preprotein translocase YajC subunit